YFVTFARHALFFSSIRRHTRSKRDWSSDVCSSDLNRFAATFAPGSVIKPVTGAIGLKNGTIKHGDGITINGLTWGKEGWGGNKEIGRASCRERVQLSRGEGIRTRGE